MRIKVSPLVLAVALGLLNPAALDGAPDGAPSQRGRVKQERPSGGDAVRADDDGNVVDAGDRG
jgi:hypothetical protein